MKNVKFLLPAALLVISACSQTARNTQNPASGVDSVAVQGTEAHPIFAKLKINNTIKTGEQVNLKFTVYNEADTAQQFCKWHTPFEPLLSKYLDVKGENGEEVAYKGPMAKRMMPQPADSYIKVNPKDSLSIDVDLLKGYDLKNPGKYTITYVGQNMSGLVVKDSVSFTYSK